MRISCVTAISIGLILLTALPAFASGAPYSVSGTVIDVHGNPVKGANVSLMAMEPMDSTNEIILLNTTLTDSSGYYCFIGTTSERMLAKVIVSYNDGNRTYQVPAISRWVLINFNPENNTILINSSETQFWDYPPATDGFVHGVLYTNDTPFGKVASGDVYLVSVDGTNTYHERVNTSNNSYFIFHVPAGSYEIYAVRDVGDLRYTSSSQNVTVLPGWSLDYVNSTTEVTKDYGLTTVINGVPLTTIYLEPGTRQLIMPSPTAPLNTSALANEPASPEISVTAVVGVTAGGAAVVSCAYLLFKFFGVGTVARAHSRIDKNKNRNDLFKFIANNPGVTLHDIANTLDMNLGTIRYHLFILSQNHRIVSSKFDDKFVRYFTNSGSFSKNEQLIISLVRRDGVKNVISLLLSEPGLTNADISSRLGIQVSATSRYIKELLEKGLVAKAPQENGTLLYSIDDGQKQNIIRVMERVNNV